MQHRGDPGYLSLATIVRVSQALTPRGCTRGRLPLFTACELLSSFARTHTTELASLNFGSGAAKQHKWIAITVTAEPAHQLLVKVSPTSGADHGMVTVSATQEAPAACLGGKMHNMHSMH